MILSQVWNRWALDKGRSVRATLPGGAGVVSLARCLSVNSIPDRANIVVVGGGIIGTSVAYHLAKLGVEDVLLLEKDKLTSGTTWHAAGLMNSFGSLSSTSTHFRQYSQELYRDVLPEETGLSAGYMDIGFIELAADPDRLQSYRRIAAFNRFLGVNVSEIGPQEVQERFPLCNVSDILAGFFVPSDGRANPTDACLALAKGARLYGATIVEHAPVSGVTTSPNLVGPPTVTGVQLENGQIVSANKVVNCAGMWARQFGEACGVTTIPNQAAEHYYIITENVNADLAHWPVIEDSSKCVYIRPEGGGLMLGFFEWQGAAWNHDRIPERFSFGQIDPDIDRMAPYVEAALQRVPDIQNIGIKQFFCGPESFTPDNNPIVGECPELRNYFVAAGLNSIGILTGGGIGKLMASWIRDGHAPSDLDVTCINANRFHRYQSNPKYRQLRAGEALGNTYRVHFPDEQLLSCRNAKQSVLHDRLEEQGAYFREVSGWESPAWYGQKGTKPVVAKHSFGRENWFPRWKHEHEGCREGVALFDMSFMSKFLVCGRDAGSFLNRLSTANVDGDCLRIKYTQWLNERGFMEADLTVTKLKSDEFLVVATDTMHNHVHDYMTKRIRPGDHVFIQDVTSRYAQVNLQGPKSRALLQELTSFDMQNLEFGQVADIDIDIARALCVRVTYVGELGYELYVPVEQTRLVYDRAVDVGAKYGLVHAGLRALGSLRLEKGYRDYGHDMDNTDTILECGLGFTCDFEKDFIGKEHVLAQKKNGLLKRMVSVLLADPEPLLHHGEVLHRNGEPICEIRSGSYGHTLGGAIGLAMLESREPIKKSFLDAKWEVDVAGQMFDCRASLKPFYDPQNSRIKQ